jgi:hypothetical protein
MRHKTLLHECNLREHSYIAVAANDCVAVMFCELM